MKFYVDDKKYDLDYKKMQKNFISSGFESDVYRFDNKVYKFYKEVCLKYRLDKKSVEYLSKIKTNRLLLPKDVIYDENKEFFGYSMKYIKPIEKEEIENLKVDRLLKDLLLIKKDLLLLKDKNVFIDDLCESNFIFNNGIYLIDPGSYEINKKRSKEYIEIINREIMNDFVIKYVLFRRYGLDNEDIRKLHKVFPLDEYISDIISKEKNKKQLVNEYSNRIINSI